MSTKYVILHKETIGDLEDTVNRYIEYGYMPIGGLVTSKKEKEKIFCQAMFYKDS